MNILTLILSGIISLLVSLAATKYQLQQESEREKKRKIENWKKETIDLLRKIQGNISEVISENAREEASIEDLDSFTELVDSVEKYDNHLRESPLEIDTDLEMQLGKIKWLFDSMDYWETHSEEELRDEYWFEVDEAKKRLKKDLKN